MRLPIWMLLMVPPLLSGCYGQKMLREPITVEEVARDCAAIREQQASLDKRLGALEQRAAEQAELLRGLKAESASRSEDLDSRVLAIDSKLRDALGSHGSYATSSTYWSATPSTRGAPGGAEQIGEPGSPPGGEATGTPGGPSGPEGGPPAVRDSSLQSSPNSGETEAKRIYDQAYLDLTRGNYSLAVLGFREFLRRAPNAELADNSQYWIGECYYAQRDFTQAVQEFLKVGEQYPRGDKVPAALLKIGYSYLQLDDRPSARRYLNQVIEQYPSSDEAGLARNKLRSAG